MSTLIEITPEELGLAAVDLTDVDNHLSGLIDGREAFAFQVHCTVGTITGSPSATGLATVNVTLFANDKTTELGTFALATSINTKTTGNKSLIVFGGGVTASVASASGYSGTLGTDADKIKVIGWFKIDFQVTELTDAAGTASVRLLAEKS
jgi:hypothetical protein